MASNPELRDTIAEKVQAAGVVNAESIGDLKRALGMDGVTNTQFSRALRSLHYKERRVRVSRPNVVDMAPRPYRVSMAV